MFRFTIRELLLLTVIVALGLGWGLESWRSVRLQKAIASAELERELSRAAIESLHQDIERIEKELPPHGLTLAWSREMRPSIQKLARPNR
jgi:hypothetical protein